MPAKTKTFADEPAAVKTSPCAHSRRLPVGADQKAIPARFTIQRDAASQRHMRIPSQADAKFDRTLHHARMQYGSAHPQAFSAREIRKRRDLLSARPAYKA